MMKLLTVVSGAEGDTETPNNTVSNEMCNKLQYRYNFF